MKVEIERVTSTGERLIHVSAHDTAKNPVTVHQWIRMLQLAERWLREGQQLKQETTKKK
jgi:hypothetical protein